MTYAESVHTWCKNQLSARPGYYSGRGPNRGDLNSQHLEMLYQGIADEHGKDAAGNFVQFVANLSDMSATSFLVAFEKFFRSGFAVTDIEQQQGDQYTLSSSNEVEAFGCIMSGLMRRGNDETDAWQSFDIKCEFLRNHGVEPKRTMRSRHAGFTASLF